MKKVRNLYFLIVLFASTCWATTSVTGTIGNLGTGTVGSGAFVRFWLRGCAGNNPRVAGSAIIGPSQGGVFYFDMVANGSGAISGTLYSTRDATGAGNGDIECGGSLIAAWYGMQVYVSGKGGPEVPIHAKIGVPFDISNVTPLTTNPIITPPTGDSTYCRLDGGNCGITGPITTKNITVAGAISTKSLENLQFADQFSGADICVKTQAAVNALGGPGVAVIPTGSYAACANGNGVTVSGVGQYILCPGGKRATILTVASNFTGAVFTFSASGVPLVQTGIYGCRFDGTGNSNQKTAIIAQDVSQFFVDEVNTQNWTGASSIGIQLKGKELINLSRDQFSADIPIDIEKNPDGTIALDGTRFQDLYLLPSGTNPNINVGLNDLTSVLQHWRLDGIDMIGGQSGILVNDSTETAGWLDIDLHNMHWEQQSGSGGYMINWNRTAGGRTTGMTLSNVDAGTANSGADGGFFFKNTFNLSGIGLIYQGTTGTAISMDSTNFDPIVFTPFLQTGSTITWSPSGSAPGGISYLAPNDRLRTGVANSSYFLDLGNVTVNNGDGTAGGSWTFTGGNAYWTEIGAPAGAAGKDVCWADSGAHRFKCNNNNAGATTPALFTDNLGVFATGSDTGTGNVVRQTSPSLTTPNIGAATATSVTISSTGLLQLGSVAFASLGTPSNASFIYCSDCKNVVDDAAIAGAACANSGHGAFAKRENGRWDCN